MISSDLSFNVDARVGTCKLTTNKCCTGRPVPQEVDGVSDPLEYLRRDCRCLAIRVPLQHRSTCRVFRLDVCDVRGRCLAFLSRKTINS